MQPSTAPEAGHSAHGAVPENKAARSGPGDRPSQRQRHSYLLHV